MAFSNGYDISNQVGSRGRGGGNGGHKVHNCWTVIKCDSNYDVTQTGIIIKLRCHTDRQHHHIMMSRRQAASSHYDVTQTASSHYDVTQTGSIITLWCHADKQHHYIMMSHRQVASSQTLITLNGLKIWVNILGRQTLRGPLLSFLSQLSTGLRHCNRESQT